ncbi:hypothetical protein L1987_32278 [Smallanthus sonchifolius]|uniref:Uncharacterized protein n=1 Tax=Smallanthus sonchifolius TaxID=185202 RepID=A0ACB9I956_9ASTR|nr:hypothetical protein L1987_32278 [Smallanthus sonchifolius]
MERNGPGPHARALDMDLGLTRPKSTSRVKNCVPDQGADGLDLRIVDVDNPDGINTVDIKISPIQLTKITANQEDMCPIEIDSTVKIGQDVNLPPTSFVRSDAHVQDVNLPL